MEFKGSPQEFSRSPRYRFGNKLLFVLSVTFILFLTILTDLKGVKEWLMLKGFFLSEFRKAPVSYLKSIPEEYWESMLADNELPKIKIDIKYRNWAKLSEKRFKAINRGLLIKGEDDFVKADIQHDNKKTKVKLRLKGDHIDHLLGNKWSFRVKVEGSDHVFGMRRFSLQNPRVRRFQSEPLFLRMLDDYGILAPRYFFTHVYVNGEDVGVMALEEHFSKELMERNGRKESVILHVDESRMFGAIDKINTSPYSSLLHAFREKRIFKSEELTGYYAAAIGMVRGFLAGHLSASNVFDEVLMGRFFALVDAWGAGHAVGHNLRLYYNPITAKLEPVGFDANVGEDTSLKNGDVLGRRIETGLFRKTYRETLVQLEQQLSDSDYLSQLAVLDNKFESELRGEFFLKPPEFFDHFYEMRSRIADILKNLPPLHEEKIDQIAQNYNLIPAVTQAPHSNPYFNLIDAFLIENSARNYLEVTNTVDHMVELRSLVSSDSSVAQTELLRENFPITLRPGEKMILELSEEMGTSRADTFRLMTALEGSGEVTSEKIRRYFPVLTRPLIPTVTLNEQLIKHSFLRVDSDRKVISALQGEWEVEGLVVIPIGYKFHLKEGTTLRFHKDGGIISFGDVLMQGSENDPVILMPQDDHNGWQGLAVIGNGDVSSSLEKVIVRNTKGFDLNGWTLTGSLVFYRNNLNMSDCLIVNNQGEDAINAIHSTVTFTDVDVRNANSDAIDLDFSQGKISGGVFSDISGDAIDLSGSNVELTDASINEIGDKALSVGEASHLKARNVVISNVSIALASKDGSSTEFSNSSITDASFAGIMAYVKKPEYGPGTISASGIEFMNTAVEALSQTGNQISLNGNEVIPRELDVEKIYEGTAK